MSENPFRDREEFGMSQYTYKGYRQFYSDGKTLPPLDTVELTRYKTIELAAQALVRNERDLGIVSVRYALMDDLKKALAS